MKRITLIIATMLLAITTTGVRAEDSQGFSGVQDVIDQQLQAFKSKNHDAAFSHAAPGIKSMVGNSTDRFIDMVKNGYGPIYSARDYSFSRNKFEGGQAFQEVLITGPQGGAWKALYALKQQPDGSWKITSVRLLKDTGGST